MRRITNKSLERKCKQWQKILKLSEWNITARFAPPSKMIDGDTTAQLDFVSVPEKVAVILVYERYYNHPGFNLSWNIDTVLLHEMIHLLMFDKTLGLPEQVKKNTKFKELEEFICDSVARIIFDGVGRKK